MGLEDPSYEKCANRPSFGNSGEIARRGSTACCLLTTSCNGPTASYGLPVQFPCESGPARTLTAPGLAAGLLGTLPGS